MQWPQGDEDQMWALAGDWHTAADSLRAIHPDIDAAQSASVEAYIGDGIEQMINDFKAMRDGQGSLSDLADNFGQVGDSVYGGGTNIQYQKMMFYSTLVMTAADLALV